MQFIDAIEHAVMRAESRRIARVLARTHLSITVDAASRDGMGTTTVH